MGFLLYALSKAPRVLHVKLVQIRYKSVFSIYMFRRVLTSLRIQSDEWSGENTIKISAKYYYFIKKKFAFFNPFNLFHVLSIRNYKYRSVILTTFFTGHSSFWYNRITQVQISTTDSFEIFIVQAIESAHLSFIWKAPDKTEQVKCRSCTKVIC